MTKPEFCSCGCLRPCPWHDTPPWHEDPICDGCAQLESECLCGLDLAEVLDCASPFHPGCRNCESK